MGPYKNVYTAAEYKQLQELNEAALEQNKILRRQLDEVTRDLARHGLTIKELEKERFMLLQQIERAVDEQKVELPREVAEAIEDFRKDGNDVDYIIRNLTKSVGPIGTPSRRLQTLKDFASENRGYDLIMALINGYTIEPTPSEKLAAKVEGLLKEWFDPDGSLSAEHIHQATQQIVEHAEELIT